MSARLTERRVASRVRQTHQCSDYNLACAVAELVDNSVQAVRRVLFRSLLRASSVFDCLPNRIALIADRWRDRRVQVRNKEEGKKRIQIDLRKGKSDTDPLGPLCTLRSAAHCSSRCSLSLLTQ